MTNGLQEAINWFCQYGYDCEVLGGTCIGGNWPPPYGPGPTTGDLTCLACQAPIIVPAMEKGRFIINGVSIIYTGPATNAMWVWDSFEIGYFDSRGSQLVGDAAGGMCFVPRTAWPIDPNGPTIASATFNVGAICVGNSTGYCVQLNATEGPIINSKLSFEELNGGAYGIMAVGGIHGIQNNTIRSQFTHGNAAVAIGVGSGPSDNSICGNRWDVFVDGTAGSVGIDVWGNRDVFTGSVSGPNLVGLKQETGSYGNKFLLGRCEGSTPIQDLTSGANKIY